MLLEYQNNTRRCEYFSLSSADVKIMCSFVSLLFSDNNRYKKCYNFENIRIYFCLCQRTLSL